MLVNKHSDPPLRETAEAKAHLRPPANTRLKAGLIHNKPALITLVGPADDSSHEFLKTLNRRRVKHGSEYHRQL
jgi:Leucine-rich repeat (LRR) protein